MKLISALALLTAISTAVEAEIVQVFLPNGIKKLYIKRMPSTWLTFPKGSKV